MAWERIPVAYLWDCSSSRPSGGIWVLVMKRWWHVTPRVEPKSSEEQGVGMHKHAHFNGIRSSEAAVAQNSRGTLTTTPPRVSPALWRRVAVPMFRL